MKAFLKPVIQPVIDAYNELKLLAKEHPKASAAVIAGVGLVLGAIIF